MTIRPSVSIRSPRQPRTLWCCQCMRVLTYAEDVGPVHHISAHPGHKVVECVGEFYLWEDE